MSDEHDTPVPSRAARLMAWIDARFPATRLWNEQWGQYIAPKNFDIWYFFGSLALLVLVMQIVTGIFLTMHYKPDAATAFASVEYIMREVPGGWIIRYMHSTGASAFFVVVYLHMARGLIYGSHRRPRELVWIFGCAIFLCLMAEAFFGYLLPWGQMSYWGAQVITNLFGAIPFIGPDLALLIRGDYVVSDATLNRFFALHIVAVPLVLLGLVAAHLLALHDVGSNNPDGIEIKERRGPDGRALDGIPSHPYYTVHDLFGVSVFLLIFCAVMFFAPEMGGYFLEYNNFIPADPLKTPPHFAPVWYFTPYYTILRATTDPMVDALCVLLGLAAVWHLVKGTGTGAWRIGLLVAAAALIALMQAFDAKFWGVVLMGGAVVILFFLPWLDRSAVKSIRYRPGWHRAVFALFFAAFVVLGVQGTQPPAPAGSALERLSQACTLIYFGFFALMPWWSRQGTFKTVPERVTGRAH